MIVVFIFSSL